MNMKNYKLFGLLFILLFASGCENDTPVPAESSALKYGNTYMSYIDADNKTDIENYLNDVFHAKHNSYWINIEKDLWYLVTTNNEVLSSGNMVRKNIEPKKIPVSFKLLPYEGQARGVMQWTFTEIGKPDRLFYVFMIGSPKINKLYLYEELTSQFQSIFPEFQIDNVILRQELNLISE